MDKSLWTNLHLWRFFTRAKQTVRRKFIYTCSAPPPFEIVFTSQSHPIILTDVWTAVWLHTISTRVSNIVWGEGHSEIDNPFLPKRWCLRGAVSLKCSVLKTQKMNCNYEQVLLKEFLSSPVCRSNAFLCKSTMPNVIRNGHLLKL